jgi:hypothetical protein
MKLLFAALSNFWIITRRITVGSTAAIMEKGTEALLKSLGVLDTEQFISTLLKEPFDYTKWSREYFSFYDPDRFLHDAIEYDKNNPVQN